MERSHDGHGSGLATPNQVRGLGVFFVVGGAVLLAFYQDMYLKGIVPVPWVGGALIALGGWCVLAPDTPWLRERTGRLFSQGD